MNRDNENKSIKNQPRLNRDVNEIYKGRYFHEP
jgi:hypothetical protein